MSILETPKVEISGQLPEKVEIKEEKKEEKKRLTLEEAEAEAELEKPKKRTYHKSYDSDEEEYYQKKSRKRMDFTPFIGLAGLFGLVYWFTRQQPPAPVIVPYYPVQNYQPSPPVVVQKKEEPKYPTNAMPYWEQRK